MKASTPVLLLLGGVAAERHYTNLLSRQAACPQIHVFGARETTAPPGFGSSQTVVNLVLDAFPGATSEAIVYPAAGGNNYSSSVTAGIKAVADQTTAFATRCPNARIVLVGYSQVGSGFNSPENSIMSKNF
jgi:acetylxylan esterase